MSLRRHPALGKGVMLFLAAILFGGVSGRGAESPSTPCADGTASAPDRWRLLKASADLSLLRSTQSQETYAQETDSQKEWHSCGGFHQRTFEEFIASYDSKHGKSGTTVTRAIELKLQQVLFVSETDTNTRYWAATARGFHNSSLGLYLEDSVGFGAGMIRTFSVPTTTTPSLVATTSPAATSALPPTVQLDADLRLIDERFYKVPGSTKIVGVLLAERYVRRVGIAKVTETVQLIPALNKSHAWQGKGIFDVTAPLNHTETFGLSVKLSDDYLANAPAGFRKSYLKLTLGVAFTPPH